MNDADGAINVFGGALLGERRRTDRLIAVAAVSQHRRDA